MSRRPITAVPPGDPLLQPHGAAIVSPPAESLLTRADRVLRKLDEEIARLEAEGHHFTAERVRGQRAEVATWIDLEEGKRGKA